VQGARRTDPDLSVVIVTWNVKQDLHRCISSLLREEASGAIRLERIVVDNASTDGTVESLGDCPVALISNGRNMGYGTANNIGLRAARGKYLLVLNPDTLLQPGSLACLLEFAAAHQRAGIITPRLLNADGSVQPSAFRMPTLLMAVIDLFPLPNIVPGRVRSWLYRSRLNGRYPGEEIRTSPFRIDHPLGACLLLRREAFEQCGGFDERIFMYSEEIDLAIRYERAGWQCWQVPASQVVHFGGRSTGQLPERMFLELWRSRLYLYAKYYSRPRQAILRALLRIAMLRDIIAGSKFWTTTAKGRRRSNRSRRAKAVLRMLKSQ
jgi:N-acetylglucosaminyl-diphospho-decaprenol L-rhamnosyltransferase